jgi:hypothetical protein
MSTLTVILHAREARLFHAVSECVKPPVDYARSELEQLAGGTVEFRHGSSRDHDLGCIAVSRGSESESNCHGSLDITVHLGSIDGVVIGRYRHPGVGERKIGTSLDERAGLGGGPWRVSDYVQTDESAPANDVLIVERIGD